MIYCSVTAPSSQFLNTKQTAMECSQAPSVVAFGIPTLDFSFLVSDKSVIEKYELNVDSQRELADDLLNLLKLECHE